MSTPLAATSGIPIYVGTAGWAIPRGSAGCFPTEGAGLQRYAARLNATEINSTFYRSHLAKTFERWRAITPPGFRFAVKAPRALSHEARLRDCGPRLSQFLEEVAPLGEKLGPLLVQLPPSLAFERALAESFFETLRTRWAGPVVFEPRHPSWFDVDVHSVLQRWRIARVAADPALAAGAGRPGGYGRPTYWRFHGSPRIYFSSYPPDRLKALADDLVSDAALETWCVFDNTASGAAATNALAMAERLRTSTDGRAG
jgi:uncharacterized protein YecE (DUF72 family)